MSIDIRLKHSSVQDNVPSPDDLVLGELAVNCHENSPALYIKDTADNIVEISGQGGIEEAPEDGQQYARQDGAWSVVEGGGEDGIVYNGASAWGLINGIVGELSAGQNCAVQKASTGVYNVTFNTPMPSAGYAVTASISGGGGQRLGINNQTANGFTANLQAQNGNPVDAGVGFAVHATNALAPMGGTGADGWAKTTSAGQVNTPSFNLECNRTAQGIYEYTFNTQMPSSTYAVVSLADNNAARVGRVQNQTPAGFTIQYTTPEGSVSTDTAHSVVVHGSNATLPSTITMDMWDDLVARVTALENA